MGGTSPFPGPVAASWVANHHVHSGFLSSATGQREPSSTQVCCPPSPMAKREHAEEKSLIRSNL